MKRCATLLMLALAMFQPVAASAKLMVVFDTTPGTNATTHARGILGDNQIVALTTDLLSRVCGPNGYKLVHPMATKTEYCGTGVQVWNAGTSGQYTETFDAVLHIGFNGRRISSFTGTLYRPESLTVGGATYSHNVPQLYWPMQGGNTSTIFLPDSAIDSCGVTSNPSLYTSALVASCQWLPNMVPLGDASLAMSPTAYSGFATRNSTSPAGGLRKYVSFVSGNTPIEQAFSNYPEDGRLTCAWCDSVDNNSSDSLSIWSRPMAHINGAKPLVFANVYGTGTCQDSGGSGNNQIPCEWDASIALMSLAILDSLSGGNVFDKNLLPLKLGTYIAGGYNRSGMRNAGGIDPSDTTALKASLDSLATLGMRFKPLIGVDMDSVGSYPNEKAWWDKLPAARFSPMTRAGMDTSAALGNTSNVRPVDAWGRYRNRIALGDLTGLGADTASIATNLQRLFYKADSTFGRSRVSRFIAAPEDDWSAKNLRVLPDSSLFAASKAGAVGLLINVQEVPTGLVANPRGYNLGGQKRWTGFGRELSLLGHTGYRIAGSWSFFDFRSDSNTSVDADFPCQDQGGNSTEQFAYPHLVAYECYRAINGLLMTVRRDQDMQPNRYPDAWDGVNTPVNDRLYPLRHASVFRMSVQDFGSGGLTPATRAGWWTVKSIDNWMRTTNRLAGRAVVVWDYPENIAP